MFGEPTADVLPEAPAAAPYRFGEGLAIGPDLEGAAEVALAQALSHLGGNAPDLVCTFYAFAGDHYSLTVPGGRHTCVGCHPGHSGMTRTEHKHSEQQAK